MYYPGNIRVGVVIYRDVATETDPKHFEVLKFTSDFTQVSDFLSGIKARSPRDRDTVEDVTGGMLEALDMGWAPDRHNVIIHVLDHAGHGFPAPEGVVDAAWDKWKDSPLPDSDRVALLAAGKSRGKLQMRKRRPHDEEFSLAVRKLRDRVHRYLMYCLREDSMFVVDQMDRLVRETEKGSRGDDGAPWLVVQPILRPEETWADLVRKVKGGQIAGRFAWDLLQMFCSASTSSLSTSLRRFLVAGAQRPAPPPQNDKLFEACIQQVETEDAGLFKRRARDVPDSAPFDCVETNAGAQRVMKVAIDKMTAHIIRDDGQHERELELQSAYPPRDCEELQWYVLEDEVPRIAKGDPDTGRPKRKVVVRKLPLGSAAQKTAYLAVDPSEWTSADGSLRLWVVKEYTSTKRAANTRS